ncbi:hypothetical protein [Pseudogemmobacter faecipullorum]|uniref:Lipoprotein n=1 Tax=Pseudogemmobacter faecipullorum TaxID=2755041 RepID=A0ABS8CJR5_9RHOB|nr:hypothetical protein [Pseudogemmobacter faecipullorum]MCB5409601.1 hypothetical protein [Pseudogemmobacter faecipullorum]
MRYFLNAFLTFWISLSLGTCALLLGSRFLGEADQSQDSAALTGPVTSETSAPMPRVSRGPDLPGQGLQSPVSR